MKVSPGDVFFVLKEHPVMNFYQFVLVLKVVGEQATYCYTSAPCVHLLNTLMASKNMEELWNTHTRNVSEFNKHVIPVVQKE